MIATRYYHRRVRLEGAEQAGGPWQTLGEASIYCIPGMPRAQDRLALNGRQASFQRLRIINADNPPLAVQSVELAWLRRVLYFLPAAGRRYTLYLGAAGRARAPDYETRRGIPRDFEALRVCPRLSLGPLAEHEGFEAPAEPPDQARERAVFIVVVLLLVLAMIGWLVRILRRASLC